MDLVKTEEGEIMRQIGQE